MSSSPTEELKAIINSDERVGIVSPAEYQMMMDYAIAATGGKIIIIGTPGTYAISNYVPDESESPKEMQQVWRIYKVKCKSCKGNYQVKDKNSIYLTKCRLCGSGKLDFNL